MTARSSPPPVGERALNSDHARILEELHSRLNRREFVHPDPLEFLYRYDEPRDREIAGLVASALAYGRVAQILRSCEDALGRLGMSPSSFVERSSAAKMRRALSGFKHRFTTGDEVASLLLGAKRLIARHGSLGARFAELVRMGGGEREDETVLPALTRFARELCASGGRSKGGPAPGHLLPSPERGSACKRMNLYLRWMVRRDEVDPGGWEGVPRSKLVVPLDTHMLRLARAMGLTSRASADMRAALEVTRRFRDLSPDDPARYDFALTRLGIRRDTDEGEFLARWRRAGAT